jgi:hypothetical protein
MIYRILVAPPGYSRMPLHGCGLAPGVRLVRGARQEGGGHPLRGHAGGGQGPAAR